jgi:hypothetical protein
MPAKAGNYGEYYRDNNDIDCMCGFLFQESQRPSLMAAEISWTFFEPWGCFSTLYA